MRGTPESSAPDLSSGAEPRGISPYGTFDELERATPYVQALLHVVGDRTVVPVLVPHSVSTSHARVGAPR